MTEIRITNEATGGEKGQKPEQMSLLPVGPLRAVARHYAIGARKYSANNWRKGYDWSLSYDALTRHAQAFWSGEDIDEETGSPHMAAVVFHALALLEFAETHPELDNRYRAAEPEPALGDEQTKGDFLERLRASWAGQTMSFTYRDVDPEVTKLFWGGELREPASSGTHLRGGSGDIFNATGEPESTPILDEVYEQIQGLRLEHRKPREVRMRQVDWDALKLSMREHVGPELYGSLHSSSRIYGLPVIIDESVTEPTVVDREEPLIVDTNEIAPEVEQIIENAPKAAPTRRWGFQLGDRVKHARLIGDNTCGTIVSLADPMPLILWDDDVPGLEGERVGAHPENLTVVEPKPVKVGRASVREILRALAGSAQVTFTEPIFDERGLRWDGVGFEEGSLRSAVSILDALEDAGLEITHMPTSS